MLQDLQHTFMEHAKRPTLDSDNFFTAKFYQIPEWDEERYDRLGKAYDFHVWLVEDLMLELTRAANLICDEVRASILPNFRIDQGRVMVTSGPYEDLSWRTFLVQYSLAERAEPMPYNGLDGFKEARFTRDQWFEDPKVKR